MSDEQPQPEESNKPERKPGFFSRIFTVKEVEGDPDASLEQTQEQGLPTEQQLDPSQENEQDPANDVFAVGPEGFNNQPQLEEVPEGGDGKRKGVFSRWFGKKDKEEAPGDTEDTPETAEAPEEGEPLEERVETGEVAETSTAPEVPKKSWFQRLRERLRFGSGSFIKAIRAAIGLSGKLDDDTIERLEETLIASDVSMDTTLKIIQRMEERAQKEKIEGADAIWDLFKQTIEEILVGTGKVFEPKPTQDPYVVLVVGVNGVGKTTTIGKMAKRCQQAGLKPLLVAGDTFRAAAVEQLEIWAQRTESEFMKSSHGSDPSGLIFDAMKAARSRGADVVFVDTAGRLHNKKALMDELGKISRVCQKQIPGAPHETLLVLDATTGQNAIQQVRVFSEATPLTGLVMTKLDGTAKGGILITIRDQFEIPITLIGVGEGVDDLRDFDPVMFRKALFEEGDIKDSETVESP